MKNKGNLIVFSGPSGSGKGTVLAKLFEQEKDKLKMSISATTRSPRDGEVDGVHYYFMKREEFQSLIDKNGFLEYAHYCENSYGTPLKPIEDWLNDGVDVILEIEVQGALQVTQKRPDCISIFLMPPSIDELEKRLIGRNTETPEVIEKRIQTAHKEMTFAEKYSNVVVNNTVEEAVEEIKLILEKNRI